MVNERIKGHLSALLAASLFGLMSPVAKWLMAGGSIDGPVLATLRVAGSAVLFWSLSLFHPGKPIRRHDWPALIGMSLCGMALNQYLYVIGVQYTSPTNGCVIATSTPVVTLLLSALVLGQRITWRKAAGILLAACGALCLLLGSAVNGGVAGNTKGDALCMLSQLSAACYFVLFGRLLRRYPIMTLMKWLFTISTALALPLFTPHLMQVEWSQIQSHEWLSCAYVVGIGTFICYLLLAAAQKRLLPPTVAAYNYVQPVIAAAAGICWGLDRLTGIKAMAIILIAIGVWNVTRPGCRV